jgi:hypothetical protein
LKHKNEVPFVLQQMNGSDPLYGYIGMDESTNQTGNGNLY